jgi:hypothetical protein
VYRYDGVRKLQMAEVVVTDDGQGNPQFGEVTAVMIEGLGRERRVPAGCARAIC